MPRVARQLGDAISDRAKRQIEVLREYPTLNAFRNPLTRALARHFANELWKKTLEEIDFEFRLSETTVGGVKCVHYEVPSTNGSKPLFLYVHGGGFVCGSPRCNASSVLPICHLTGGEGIGVDYTLAPEARFPKQIDEVDSVYRALRASQPSRKLILVSDSAGSTMALSALIRWRDQGRTLPAGAIFMSPAIDGLGASDTHVTLDGHDPLIRSDNGASLRDLFHFYAPEGDAADPKISPIYSDLTGLPPMMIHAGTREVLLGDAARLSEFARRAGVDTTFRAFDGMFHLFHMHWSIEEARYAHADFADFVSRL